MDLSCLVCVLAVYVIGTDQDILKGVCELTAESYDCSDRDLRSVPADVPGSTRILDFSFNYLHVLLNTTFVRLTELISLDLTRCNINWIYEDILSNQQHLQTLILTGNSLVFVSDLAFLGPQSLKYLGLSQTSMEDFKFIPYTNLGYLETLVLGDNDLNSLYALTQFNLQTLKTLNLQMNALQHITVADVNVLKDTHELDISFMGNSIILIESRAFQSCHFNSLDFTGCQGLSEGNISAILEGLRGVETNYLSLGVYEDSPAATIEAQDLEAFCDISVKELNFQLQHFKDLVNTPFHCLRSLQKLDLTRAHLTSLPPTMANMTSLSKLILNENKFIDLCDTHAMVLPALTVLSVRGNLRYMRFNNSCLTSLSNLENLDLSHSAMLTGTECCEIQLAGLSRLQTLNISYNNAMAWSSLPFSQVSGLTILDCYHVNITYDHRNAGGPFRNLEQLRVLNISWSFVDLIGPGNLLHSLKSLQHLSLRRSSFKNGIISNAEMFKDVPLVESLVLAECGLLSVKGNVFHCLSKLMHADLSGNQLAVVNTNAFFSLNNILLNFARNDIKIIAMDSIKGLGKDGKIDLSDNPLACNCSNIELINWIQSNADKVVNVHMIRCGGSGGQLSDMHLSCVNSYGMLAFGLVSSLIAILVIAFFTIKRLWRRTRYILL